MRVARFQGTSILNDFKGLDVCEFGAEESHKPAHDPHSASPVRPRRLRRWGGTTAALEDVCSDVILLMIAQAEIQTSDHGHSQASFRAAFRCFSRACAASA